jgi:hypothetical protein
MRSLSAEETIAQTKSLAPTSRKLSGLRGVHTDHRFSFTTRLNSGSLAVCENPSPSRY